MAVEVQEFDGIRYYRKDENSPWHPSVTEIIDVVKDPGLEAWQVDYCVKNGDKTASERFGQLHAQYGTMVHDYLEEGTEEAAYYDPDPVRKAMYSWQLFKLEVPITIMRSQIVVFGDNYGGTTDIEVDMNGIRTLLEIKTSSALRNRAALQAEAYFRAYPDPKPERVLVLRLGKSRIEYELREPDHDVAWRKFQACRELFWDRDPWLTPATGFVPNRKPLHNKEVYEYA